MHLFFFFFPLYASKAWVSPDWSMQGGHFRSTYENQTYAHPKILPPPASTCGNSFVWDAAPFMTSASNHSLYVWAGDVFWTEWKFAEPYWAQGRGVRCPWCMTTAGAVVHSTGTQTLKREFSITAHPPLRVAGVLEPITAGLGSWGTSWASGQFGSRPSNKGFFTNHLVLCLSIHQITKAVKPLPFKHVCWNHVVGFYLSKVTTRKVILATLGGQIVCKFIPKLKEDMSLPGWPICGILCIFTVRASSTIDTILYLHRGCVCVCVSA